MKLEVKYSSKFKKGLKLAAKRGLDISLLENVVEKLKNRIPLEEKYKDHQLKGKMSKYRECHIQPDWLLVYLIEEDILVLTLIDTGTHSDLFDEQGVIKITVSKAQKAATAKYEKENYDKILVRFPKGTKEKIKAKSNSVNGFIVDAVNKELEKQIDKPELFMEHLMKPEC